MKTLVCLAWFAGAVALAGAQSRTATDEPAAAAIRRALTHDWPAAAQAGDVEGYLSFLTEDMIVMLDNEPPLVGKQALAEWLRKAFAAGSYQIKIHEPDELVLNGDWAFVRYNASIVAKLNSGDTITMDRKYLDVWKRQTDGAWKCHRHMFNDNAPPAAAPPAAGDDVLTGGVKMIPIDTPKGKFKVWTRRVGNNPRIKVLLLHGGPGATHEYFEACDSFLPAAGVEYYYYDQLGSAYSDQPDDESLWDTARFVEEVEQVRQALGLTRDSFYLLGQSWGGILAIEYALKYQQHLKGLIISNMMASIPAYNDYAKKVLMPAMDPKALAEIRKIEAAKDFGSPRYEKLLLAHYYVDHVLRLPLEKWPEPVLRMFGKLNKKLYTLMQGPSELGALPGCRLEHWDRTADLPKIAVPTLVIGARHDTMDPAHMEWMAKQFPKGQYLHCGNGSHLALYDDQATWFSGLIRFLHAVDRGQKTADSAL